MRAVGSYDSELIREKSKEKRTQGNKTKRKGE
jgi:hypothetical protein